MRSILAVFLLTALAGCSLTPSTVAGQLFCAVDKDAGTFIVAAADAGVAAEAGPLAPVGISVIGLTAAEVQEKCDGAAAAVGGTSAIPVSPPPSGTAPAVTIATATPKPS